MKIGVQAAELRDLDGSRSLLQSGFWGAFRQRLGWRAHPFLCTYREREFSLLVLRRPLPLGLALAYVPHGPELEAAIVDRERFLVDLAAALKPYLSRCLFLRFDLPWGSEGLGNPPPDLERTRDLYKAPMDVQPPSTVILDLSAEEARLLAAMKSKTRYNIGLADKKGVGISIVRSPGGLQNLEPALAEWYRLYRETARRDRITLHGEGYYKSLFALAGSYGAGAPELYLLTARHEGELLAGIIVAMKGEGAWYLYGASSDRKRNLMPNYALQWRAIRLARERGCRFYDLFGIPPDEDPQHPMHGLFRFKTGFGGRVINRPGCYDVRYRPLLYRLYRGAEGLRSAYFRRWRKRLAGNRINSVVRGS
ncbi:MAG: peptidoglycan bridge formation glycyltransferase FemA/FemB family protein [Spirochaetaceae bacterium]|nr:MAG: peptidoglycan bridge formation glycyltransferase FemA/FemB family protein [Spirochaetaceae bacterium]